MVYIRRLACVLLASKLENLHLTLSEFTGKIKNSNAQLIMDIELVLLAALHFNLHFHHPHAALAGFHLDIQVIAVEGQALDMEAAGRALDRLVTTDAILIHSPSHLALAALFYSNPTLTESYIETRLSKITDPTELLDKLRSICSELQVDKPALDNARLKDIDRRLMQARNALSTPDA